MTICFRGSNVREDFCPGRTIFREDKVLGSTSSLRHWKCLIKVNQQPHKPLGGFNQIWGYNLMKKDTSQLTSTSELRLWETAAAYYIPEHLHISSSRTKPCNQARRAWFLVRLKIVSAYENHWKSLLYSLFHSIFRDEHCQIWNFNIV